MHRRKLPGQRGYANWSQQSKNVRTSGSTAIVDLVMYHKGQNKSVSYTLTLSCDKDGNVA